MREEIDFAGFQDLAQIGMRQGDRSGFRLVIHQRHKRRVFAVRKSHPAFNPILDPRGQLCGSGGGKNHKTCIRGRPCSQVKGLRLSQHGKAPHEVAKFKVFLKPTSQLFVKVPGALSGVEILVDQYCVEEWPAPCTEFAAYLTNNCCIHRDLTLILARITGNWRKSPMALSVAIRGTRRFPYSPKELRRPIGEAVQRAAKEISSLVVFTLSFSLIFARCASTVFILK